MLMGSLYEYGQVRHRRATCGESTVYFAGYGTSMSVHSVSGNTGKGYLSRSLRVSIASVWNSVSKITRRDLSGRAVQGYPSHRIF